MAKKILLISESQIKASSIIEANVDPKILSKVIWNVQEIQLKSILGETLYSEVTDKVYTSVTNSSALDPAIGKLIDEYIHPFLIHAVVSDLILVNQYKITNKGLLKMSDDVADNVSSSEMNSVMAYHEQYKNAYKLNLINYLKEQNLIASGDVIDTDVSVESIGWFLN